MVVGTKTLVLAALTPDSPLTNLHWYVQTYFVGWLCLAVSTRGGAKFFREALPSCDIVASDASAWFWEASAKIDPDTSHVALFFHDVVPASTFSTTELMRHFTPTVDAVMPRTLATSQESLNETEGQVVLEVDAVDPALAIFTMDAFRCISTAFGMAHLRQRRRPTVYEIPCFAATTCERGRLLVVPHVEVSYARVAKCNRRVVDVTNQAEYLPVRLHGRIRPLWPPSTTAAAREEDAKEEREDALVVVVAYCKASLQTLSAHLDGVRVDVVHIYSRCHASHDYVGPGRVLVHAMSNVGSCDMVYATHLSRYGQQHAGRLVFFVKDTTYVRPLHQASGRGRWRSVPAMVAEARRQAFACGLFLSEYAGALVWHNAELRNFSMHTYRGANIQSPRHEDLQGWWKAHPALFEPTPNVIPVCYGGTFVARLRGDRTLDTTELLDDLQYQEVNHFMERSWARLFVGWTLDCPCWRHQRSSPTGIRGGMRCDDDCL